MSTVPHEAASLTSEPLANLLFDYPGADVILRSQDAYQFRVPKIYIANSSLILGDLIQRTLDPPRDPNAEASPASLPVVQLPESGEILRCLLTFIFPVTPHIPSTPEDIMKLLSVAQKYQTGTALTHIRECVAQQNSLLLPTAATGLESALKVLNSYALAQMYGLRPEALQAAKAILLKRSMVTIEDFDNKLDVMSGACLFELLKYHERVRAILALDLTEFMVSCGRGTITGLRCDEYNSDNRVPRWIDQYISSIQKAPNFFDLVEFNSAMVRHVRNGDVVLCECVSIPSQTIREFWEALADVVHGSFEKVSLVDIPSC